MEKQIKRYVSLFEQEPKFEYLVEMASIDARQSGIIEGDLVLRAKEAKHPFFPHVHYVHNLRNQEKEYIKYTIDSDLSKIKAIVIKMKITKKENKKVKQFIAKNSKALIDYYLQGKGIRTQDFLDSLKKIEP